MEDRIFTSPSMIGQVVPCQGAGLIIAVDDAEQHIRRLVDLDAGSSPEHILSIKQVSPSADQLPGGGICSGYKKSSTVVSSIFWPSTPPAALRSATASSTPR